jgi:putative membrane protein
MRKQFRCVLMATAVLLLAGGSAIAQQDPDRPQGGTSSGGAGAQTPDPRRPTGEPTATSDPRKPTGDQSDRSQAPDSRDVEKFVKEAALRGLGDVEIARLATQKASSAEVKQFAQRVVDDRAKANDELSTIAKQKNITLPTDVNGKHKKEVDRLSKLSAQEFDRAYMRVMLDDHKKDVSEFRKAASKAQDAEVKTFAAQTLPTLEEHLRTAQQFDESSRREAVGTSGTRPTPPQPAPGPSGRPDPSGRDGGSTDPLGRPGSPGAPGSGPVPGGGQDPGRER